LRRLKTLLAPSDAVPSQPHLRAEERDLVATLTAVDGGKS
jgi:hypothetical protein